MILESPSQILTSSDWRRRVETDQASGTLQAPRTLYLGAGGTILGSALLLERWPLEVAQNEARMARRLISGDPWHRRDCGQAPYRTWERESCGTCALLGLGAHSDEYGSPAPNYAGWARAYVQAREPIPRAWLPAFVSSLNDPDNERYRDALRRDVATFGWRLTDERPGYRLRTPSAKSVTAWLERHHEGEPFDMAAELGWIESGDDYPADVKRAASLALKRLGVAAPEIDPFARPFQRTTNRKRGGFMPEARASDNDTKPLWVVPFDGATYGPFETEDACYAFAATVSSVPNDWGPPTPVCDPALARKVPA